MINRKFKSVKQLNNLYSMNRCFICHKSIKYKDFFILDSRNDKFCNNCAIQILNEKIDYMERLRNELRDKSMLTRLEEDEDDEEIEEEEEF